MQYIETMHTTLRVLTTLVLLLAIPSAQAEKADKNKPVNLEADTVTMDDINKTSLYQGNVILIQGTLVSTSALLSCSSCLALYLSPGSFQNC